MRIANSLTCCLVLAGATASADVLTVELDGSGMFSSIQDAINAAQAGDEILVGPGTYSPQGRSYMMIAYGDRDVVVRSTGGAENTILNCAGVAGGIYVVGSGDGLEIDGFTILHGASLRGGGVCSNEGSPTIKNCVFDACRALYAGGAVYTETTITFDSCRFISAVSGLMGEQTTDFFFAYGEEAVINLEACVICGYDANNASAISYGEFTRDDWTYNWADCTDCNGNGELDDDEAELGDLSDSDGNGLWDHCEADCDNSGVADTLEIAAGITPDLNNNWRPDSCDSDCDGDGLPDDYELEVGLDQDCDGNGIADACDFLDETLTDCDGDGVADDCQEGLEDCDGDGQIDICQMAEGEDCNDNGLLDACEIADGEQDDLDANGWPDECDCLADMDNSGWVFYDEIVNWATYFGQEGTVADVDRSGVVDVRDLIYVLTNWGECPYDDPDYDDEDGEDDG